MDLDGETLGRVLFCSQDMERVCSRDGSSPTSAGWTNASVMDLMVAELSQASRLLSHQVSYVDRSWGDAARNIGIDTDRDQIL